jgi:hypothetical protein
MILDGIIQNHKGDIGYIQCLDNAMDFKTAHTFGSAALAAYRLR